MILLSHDLFIFRQEGLRTFSIAFADDEYFDDCEIDIEWNWHGNERRFMFTASDFIIFLAPRGGIRHLLPTGDFLGDRLKEEKLIPTVTSEAEDAYARFVHRSRNIGVKVLFYSNALATPTVEPQLTWDSMDYNRKKRE